MSTWHKTISRRSGDVTYYADRPDGTFMDVVEHTDGTITILVVAPDCMSEYLVAELEDTTVNACIQRAESVVLPDEDTGI